MGDAEESTLREKCPNTGLFLVRIFLYSDWIRRDGIRYFRDKVFTDEALFTFLTEVESIVNSRPLTAASDDINNLEAITPNHLLIGKSCPNCNSCVFQEQDISLRKKWKELQAVKDMLWKRWLKEYLPTLTEKKKWQMENRNFHIGDLVLIPDKNMDCSDWPLARTIEIRPSGDGVVQVKTTSEWYVRPAGNLSLLEHSSFHNNNE